MSKTILYRVLSKKDADAYRTLRLQSYQEAIYAFSESYEDEHKKAITVFESELETKGYPPEWFVLGAFLEEELIGFVKFRRDQRSKGRHKSMIHAMYTTPTLRSEGIGRQSVLEVIRRAKQMKGLEQIHLWVLHSENHRSAADFYSKFGFESQGVVKKDLKVGEVYIDAEYMVLYL